MEHKLKIEHEFACNDHINLKNMSIQDLVSVLRTEQFDSVEEVVVSRYEKLQTENQHLQDKFDMERLARLEAEEELKKRVEICERGKKAQNSYEKLLKEVKKNRKKNNDLEFEVCELRIRVGVLENEKNEFEVKNRELEKSMKKICEALADAGITAFHEKEIGNDTDEPKEAQGASSGMHIYIFNSYLIIPIAFFQCYFINTLYIQISL